MNPSISVVMKWNVPMANTAGGINTCKIQDNLLFFPIQIPSFDFYHQSIDEDKFGVDNIIIVLLMSNIIKFWAI